VRAWLAILFCGLAVGLHAQQPAFEEGRARFCAVDIYLDSGSTPLAAYQLEFSATNRMAKIVGIEGGEPVAFRNAPFYDPKALQHERVIVAAFSTLSASQLPAGKCRVATIHLQIPTGMEPGFTVKLRTAADAQGRKISVQTYIAQRSPK
jgi:hypothetical protein